MLPDGTGVVSPLALSEAFARGDLATTEYLRIDRSGQVLDRLFEHSEPMGLHIPLRGGGVISMEHPLPDHPLFALAPDGTRMAILERKAATVGNVAEFRLTELTLTGDTLHSTPYAYRPMPVPPEVADSMQASLIDRATRLIGAEGGRAVRGALVLPETYPPVTRLLYGGDLSLWVQREGRPGSLERWEVHSDGERRARVDVPGQLSVRLIGDRFVWCVFR